MCSRVARWAIAFACATTATAQSRQSLEQSARAVTTAYLRMDAAIARARADSVRRATLPVVRHYAGMVVRADTSTVSAAFLEAMDAAFARASETARALFGAPADTLLGSIAANITPNETGATRENGAVVTIRAEPIGARASVSTQRGDRETPVTLTNMFLDWFGATAGKQQPRALQLWGTDRIPMLTIGINNEATYRALATTSVRRARSCLNAVANACASVLMIGGDTIVNWLDADERRDLVQLFSREWYNERGGHMYYMPPGMRIQVGGCLNNLADSACINVLRATRGIRSPTGVNDRVHLVRRAIVKGGPGAYARLVAARDQNVQGALEAAAGVSIDQLLGDWQADIVAAKPRSPAPSATEIVVCMVLVIGALGISVGRRP